MINYPKITNKEEQIKSIEYEFGNLQSNENLPDLIPSILEYQEAKKIVIAYENEQIRLENLKLEQFRAELSFLFLNNKYYKIEQFDLKKEGCNLNRYSIIPRKPSLEEYYNGELNDEIEKLCQKHNIKASIIYWCYHK